MRYRHITAGTTCYEDIPTTNIYLKFPDPTLVVKRRFINTAHLVGDDASNLASSLSSIENDDAAADTSDVEADESTLARPHHDERPVYRILQRELICGRSLSVRYFYVNLVDGVPGDNLCQIDKRLQQSVSQAAEIRQLASHMPWGVCLIMAPPGHGKTYCAAFIIAYAIGAGKRVTGSAASNQAVNNLMFKTADVLQQSGLYNVLMVRVFPGMQT